MMIRRRRDEERNLLLLARVQRQREAHRAARIRRAFRVPRDARRSSHVVGPEIRER
ncbi:hypothetical protein [Paenibacillus popilliae]|uniref:hypothetical protein n=1 Tax=Paenibacillus popilliae TaxID=78057 RepID=UPI001F311B39|nr:hypothetical protein [Paenibacillus popilliae]